MRVAGWGLNLALLLVPFAAQSKALDQPAAHAQRPRWLLASFLKLAEEQPRRLLRIAEKLFDRDRIRVTTLEPSQAFDWQNRVAMSSALSQFFDPSVAQTRAMGQQAAQLRERARKVLEFALQSDPSLLVRDNAVESLRRIFRMQPREAKIWRAPLERAFLNPKNFIEGEGLFIRETILTTMREGSLTPSKNIRRAAERDLNPQVRAMLRQWDTSAYDDL